MRIEDYALVGDLQTAALVGRDGSIDWLCFPRFDSPACFAALLDSPRAGRWQMRPVGGEVCSHRRYRGDSLVLETYWENDDGAVRVVDFMPPRGQEPDLVRVVEGLRGRVRMGTELRLRFDYGNVVPWVRHVDGQLAAVAGPDAVWLASPVPLHGEDLTTVGEFTVSEGDRLPFVMTWQESWLPRTDPVDGLAALEDTEQFWSEWIGRCAFQGGQHEQLVRRSLVTLKGLTYAPTGGLVAAATTSLPEQLGGPRNWDYRFCWLRDAAFTLQALIGAGYVEEAAAWRDWLLRAVAGDPADLQIMYTLTGQRRIPEWEVDWLGGYEGSRPVRIGNDAATQFQLDVYGEVLDCLHLAREQGLSRDTDAWDMQSAIMEFLEGSWQVPDNGLWEVRGDQQHFVHSKVLAWTAADRAVSAVEDYGLPGPVRRWRALRDEIKREVCEKGYDPDRNTFTQYYGSKGLDAALLQIPRLGFLPPDDPRVVGTVEAIQRELTEDGFVLRYRPQREQVDGLPGEEGVFLACSFWLVDALAMIGRTDEAGTLFGRLTSLCNDVGLLSEEYDVVHRRLLGNFPQAFSHESLINSAFSLAGEADPRSRRARRVEAAQ